MWFTTINQKWFSRWEKYLPTQQVEKINAIIILKVCELVILFGLLRQLFLYGTSMKLLTIANRSEISCLLKRKKLIKTVVL